VALTSADVDHTAGLFVLREGGAPPVYATPPVLKALDIGLGVVLVLSAFGGVAARPLVVGTDVAFVDRAGEPLGIEARVVPVSGRPPPYMRLRGELADPEGGDTIALALWARGAAGSSRRVLYAPGIASIGDALDAEAARSDLLLVDGTCFSNDETMALVGRSSADMGHVTIGGNEGTLAWLSRYPHARRMYVHINNTNPVLMPDSAARREVVAAGVELGEDGLELEV
jgi:pyrroloquinoline quinone biosynthesis protein B